MSERLKYFLSFLQVIAVLLYPQMAVSGIVEPASVGSHLVSHTAEAGESTSHMHHEMNIPEINTTKPDTTGTESKASCCNTTGAMCATMISATPVLPLPPAPFRVLHLSLPDGSSIAPALIPKPPKP